MVQFQITNDEAEEPPPPADGLIEEALSSVLSSIDDYVLQDGRFLEEAKSSLDSANILEKGEEEIQYIAPSFLPGYNEDSEADKDKPVVLDYLRSFLEYLLDSEPSIEEDPINYKSDADEEPQKITKNLFRDAFFNYIRTEMGVYRRVLAYAG